MSFNAIFQNVFSLLDNDPLLVPTILGPKTVTNQRLYRAWPAMQSFLATYEPNQPSEGWLVFEEAPPAQRMENSQLATNHEFLNLLFHVYATTYSLTHKVLDVLDTMLHWTVLQQRDLQWGNRIVLFTRRTHEVDKYEQGRKLYEKQIGYYLEMVLEEDPA